MRNREKQTRRILRVAKHITSHRLVYGLTVGLIALGIAGLITYIIWPKQQPVSTNPAAAEYQRQLPTLKKDAESNPQDATAQQNYAVALYASGDTQAAKQQYEKLISLSPNDPIAFNNLANTQRDLGETSAAIDSYKKSLTLNPRQANVYSNLANVQLYTLGDSQAAIATYREGLQQLPNNSDLEFLLGVAFEQTNDSASAKTTYQHILTYEPSHKPSLAALERLNP